MIVWTKLTRRRFFLLRCGWIRFPWWSPPAHSIPLVVLCVLSFPDAEVVPEGYGALGKPVILLTIFLQGSSSCIAIMFVEVIQGLLCVIKRR